MNEEIEPTSEGPERSLIWFFGSIPSARELGEQHLRLGLGEFETGTAPWNKWRPRRAFLSAVFDVAPEAWEDLMTHARHFVAHHYTDLSDEELERRWSDLEDLRSNDPAVRNSAGKRLSVPVMPEAEAKALRAALRGPVTKWARTWRLGDEKHLALSRLAFTDAISSAIDERDGTCHTDEIAAVVNLLALTPERAWSLTEEDLQPESWTVALEGWAPTRQTWSDFATRARQTFERELEKHRREYELAAETAGWTRTPFKRDGLLHFRWLARFQVKRESISSIARSEYRGRSTVREGIDRVAALIDLPLRTARRGSTPKTGSDEAAPSN